MQGVFTLSLYPEDDNEEQTYLIQTFTKEILEQLESRHNFEKINFKAMSKENIASRLNGDIAKLPTLLHQDFYQTKSNILNVACDLYCYLAILHFEKENKK